MLFYFVNSGGPLLVKQVFDCIASLTCQLSSNGIQYLNQVAAFVDLYCAGNNDNNNNNNDNMHIYPTYSFAKFISLNINFFFCVYINS